MANPATFAGISNAWAFAYGTNPDVTDLQVDLAGGPSPTGSTTLTVAFGNVTLGDGTVISPLETTTPIKVGSGANEDSVTPSAVSVASPTVYQSTSFTASFTYHHGTGDRVSSATVGLQEALNYAAAQGGGTVVVDAQWAANGGTDAMIAAATVPSGVDILDNRQGTSSLILSTTIPLTLAQLLTLHSAAVEVIPAPGTTSAIDVIDAVLELKYGSAAFSGGGAVQLSYGNAVTYPASATIAATVFTTFSASHSIKVAGALAVTPNTNFVDAAIYLFMDTADFTVGTGATGILRINYKVLTGF